MILRVRPGCFRFTSVLVARGNRLQRYGSLGEMPPGLRARCLRALEGPDSATVLIAGRSRPEPSAGPSRASRPAAPPARLALRRMGLVAAVFQLLAAGLGAALCCLRLAP